MTKRKKAKRIFISIIAILAFLMIAAGTFAVNHALARKKTLKTEFAILPADEGSKIGNLQNANKRRLGEAVSLWRKTRIQEDWNITALDGTPLYAAFYPALFSHKFVIFCHGYGDSTEKFENLTVMFALKGYSVVMPNLRGHGKTGGKFIGMGWKDSQDMLLWIDKILKTDPKAQIVLMGLSMGGATVMMTSGLDLPENVKCIVEDSGYASVWEQFRDRMKVEQKLPAFPLLYVANIISKFTAGYSFREASSVERVKNCKVPMLFMHGEKDAYVFPYMMNEVKAAYGGPYSETVIMEDSDHVRGYLTYPDVYFKAVFDFIEKFVD